MSFRHFFEAATDGNSPYAYQCRLACGDGADPDDASTLLCGTECSSKLIDIPTGLGKTAAVVLAWLWNRVIHPPLRVRRSSQSEGGSTLNFRKWPRRLVYCLPMRTLVEQTASEVGKWLRNLGDTALRGELAFAEATIHDLVWLAGMEGLSPSEISNLPSGVRADAKPHSPVILMGGEELDDARREWDLHPEKPAILIGTQDMLLSRALNRGYGMSRYRWPMHFGLLNNDCLWVMDETQLIGVGVETSAQLEAFRERLGAWGRAPTWWMSATLDEARVQTVDQRALGREIDEISLSAGESARLADRLNASKRLTRAPVSLDPATKRNYTRELARFVVEKAAPHALTLIILNRFGRAQEIYRQLLR